MKDKKNLRMIMAGIFCIGVLLAGVGTGIAFAEFSSFAYQPIYASPEVFLTEEFTYQIKPEDSERIWLNRYFGGTYCTVEEDETLSEEIIEISAMYNAELCMPDFIPCVDNEGELRIQFYLNYMGSDLSKFMKYKDTILEGIRNRELRDYQEDYIKQVKIRVNPATRNRLYLN